VYLVKQYGESIKAGLGVDMQEHISNWNSSMLLRFESTYVNGWLNSTWAC